MKPITTRDSYQDGRKHRELVGEKYFKIEGLLALLQTHEAALEPDADYIRQLKRKLVSTRNQLRAMTGDSNGL